MRPISLSIFISVQRSGDRERWLDNSIDSGHNHRCGTSKNWLNENWQFSWNGGIRRSHTFAHRAICFDSIRICRRWAVSTFMVRYATLRYCIFQSLRACNTRPHPTSNWLGHPTPSPFGSSESTHIRPCGWLMFIMVIQFIIIDSSKIASLPLQRDMEFVHTN